MNKIIYLTVVAIALAVCVPAEGGVTAFNPDPIDLDNLPHAWYYTWGIDFQIPDGEIISEAVFTFSQIYNWQAEVNHLYLHLLDDPVLGVVEYHDMEGEGDNFANPTQGVLIGTWSDPVGGASGATDLSYTFSANDELLATLNAYAADGRVGFGVDPDCHYFNEGVTFTITTAASTSSPPVTPVPGAMLLGGIGMGLIGWLRRRKAL